MDTNPALLRRAHELNDLLAEILNANAEAGISFYEVVEAVQGLYVSYPGAEHLLGDGSGNHPRPTHVPPIAEDPIMHVLTQLAFEVADLPLTVRNIEVIDRLTRFKRLSEHLLRLATRTTRLPHH